MKIFFIVVILFVSCSSSYNDLNMALVASGNNRTELEKVLLHYSKNDADSLQLRAAEFLIRNMPGHYSYSSDEISNYVQVLDSINPQIPFYLKEYLYLFPLTKDYVEYFAKKKYDTEHITADFLIRNIDLKFKLREIVPWAKYITFNDFCEYLLPYRIDEETLEYINQDDLEDVINKLEALSKDIHNNSLTIFASKEDIAERIIGAKPFTFPMDLTKEELSYVNPCYAKAYIATNLYRYIGIPASLDFVPHWANDGGRHRWCNTIDVLHRNTRTDYIFRSRIAKVFRKTYSHNKSPKRDKNLIPDLFTPFIKDVTNEYIKTADITVQYRDCVKNDVKNVYLSVFNDAMWQPIAWNIINKKGYAQFEQMGKDIVYLPIYYEGKKAIVSDYPFILNFDGTTTKLIPNENDKIKLHLERKYPLNIYKLNWAETLVGAVIEASDNKSFSNPDTVYTIEKTTPNSIYKININSSKSYRYIRIVKNNENSRMLLSELIFIDNFGNKLYGELSSGQVLDNESYYDTKQERLKPILSDGDFLSYATIPHWIGIDFGKQNNISSVTIGLRNDGNYIYPNNTYELLYHNNKGWVSLGTKNAITDFIDYCDVPSGALYWLRNRSAGIEERIFTYENGKMKFW